MQAAAACVQAPTASPHALPVQRQQQRRSRRSSSLGASAAVAAAQPIACCGSAWQGIGSVGAWPGPRARRRALLLPPALQLEKQQQQQQQPAPAAGVACRALGAAGGGEHQQQQRNESGLVRTASALYRFSRPHTIVGTAISVLSVSLLAAQSLGAPVGCGAAWAGAAYALSAALLMNVAIVGINQLYDIEIDKVNKPYLPLASGELSVQSGTYIVAGCAAASLAIGFASGSAPLLATLGVSLALGIVYSTELPFMRWKRSPVLAAACILVVRALAVQLGFYYHMQVAIGAPHLALTPAIAFAVSFMLLFSIVIALFKDVPDAKGDNGAGVRTLTVQLGAGRVFWACIWLLTCAYMGAVAYSLASACSMGALSAGSIGSVAAGSISSLGSIVAGAVGSPAASSAAGAGAAGVTGLLSVGSIGSVVAALLASLSISSAGTLGARTAACVAGHVLMAALLWRRALQVDLESQQDITDCYMFVWRLFYAEYLLIPLLL